ncbi:MAG: hypothetical protein IPK26_02675 [Planctomycetes bacterium]|nr:hypothetical protein [Planctomycetota bacterium]
MQATETGGQEAAGEDRAEFAFAEGRECRGIGVARRGGGDARAEGLQVLLDDLVQRGRFRPAANPLGCGSHTESVLRNPQR